MIAAGDSGPRPDDHRAEVEMVLEFIQRVWNDRDLEKVEIFMIRDLVLHTIDHRTVIRPEGYRRALLQAAAALPRAASSRSATSRPTTPSATPDCGSR